MKDFISTDGKISISNVNALDAYDKWDAPIVIVSDGPYGVSGFLGDLPSAEGLAEWYEPHIKKWSEKATPETTLWFWNTEVGWATVHPVLVKHGWKYINYHVWDKGISHVAGNSNTKTLRKLPIVTEACAQYIKEPVFQIDGKPASMKEWLRAEWKRTGLPFKLTNEAAEVKDAATRKWFTKCHLWYFPPPEPLEKIIKYANIEGNVDGRPYFSIDGKSPLTAIEWEKMRAKFHCPIGITNVWQEPTLNGKERVKTGSKALHLNQKPLKLIQLIIELSSDENDLIWDPFGGLATSAIAARNLNRRCILAEMNSEIYEAAIRRYNEVFITNPNLLSFHE